MRGPIVRICSPETVGEFTGVEQEAALKAVKVEVGAVRYYEGSYVVGRGHFVCDKTDARCIVARFPGARYIKLTP